MVENGRSQKSRGESSDVRQNKLCILSAFAKIDTMNIFQGICFVVPHSTRVCIRTCVVAVWKDVGELQIVSTSLQS